MFYAYGKLFSWCYLLSFALFLFIVLEAKDGTISVASAFSGYQEGNFKVVSYLISSHPWNEDLRTSIFTADHILFGDQVSWSSYYFSFSWIIHDIIPYYSFTFSLHYHKLTLYEDVFWPFFEPIFTIHQLVIIFKELFFTWSVYLWKNVFIKELYLD